MPDLDVLLWCFIAYLTVVCALAMLAYHCISKTPRDPEDE